MKIPPEPRQMSETRYQELFDRMRSGVAVYQATDDGEDFILVALNKAGQRITRVTTDFIGKSVCELFPGVKELGLFQVFQQVWKTGKAESLPISMYKDDQLTLWVENDVYSLPYGELVAIFDDVTARMKAEEAPKLSEERYRTILNEMEEGYQEVDLNGNFTFFNEAFLKLFGYSSDEMMGTNFSRYAAEEAISKRVYRSYKRMYQTGVPIQTDEWDIVRKDGVRRTLEFWAAMLRDGKGRPTGFRGIVRDITDRKRAEEAIQRNEARLEGLLRISEYHAKSTQDLLDYALDEAIRLTDSRIGYIYFYDDAKREFQLNTWSKEVMNECTIKEPQVFYQLDKTGIWGEAVRQARPIVVNDFQAPHPLKKGYPEGHAPLYKFLTVPVFSAGRIVAVAGVANKPTDYDESDARQLTLLMDSVWRMTEQKKSELALIEAMEQVRKALRSTVQAISVTVEARDPYTAGHQRRVADLSRAIAIEMGLSSDRTEGIWMAGLIHDLGKISVPGEILSKASRLTEIEFSLVKIHPQAGYDILKEIEFPWPIARMVLEHHERVDGSGYPSGLTGDGLLVESRILAVADVVESMASHRPYRAAIGVEAAMEEIARNRGVLYDPEAVNACVNLFRKGYTLPG
ncbi:MAG: hypothetical protein QG552_3572 [Thermodesulfobacteriota bacterium]|nr:hypothetical protein [Thermodesulfobacteriota bacterium]